MLSGVYKITNRLNEKCYVGSSNKIKPRWANHRRHAAKVIPPYKCLLHDAIRKYGLENFRFEVIEECIPDCDLLLEREQYYLDTLQPEYNICKIAGSPFSGEPWNKGLPVNEATRERLIKQGFQPDHETWNAGVPWTDDVKQKMAESATRRCESNPEVIQRMIDARSGIPAHNKGKPMPEAQRLKMTERTIAPEHQAVMTEAARIANTGRTYSQEHCDAISEGNLNSSARKAYAESRRGIARSDELKQKVSEGIISSAKFQASVQRRAGRKRVDNTSGHYGIVWDKGREKWMARVNKKSKRFATIEEAIQWRDEILAAA